MQFNPCELWNQTLFSLSAPFDYHFLHVSYRTMINAKMHSKVFQF